jgi:hypothetical protein
MKCREISMGPSIRAIQCTLTTAQLSTQRVQPYPKAATNTDYLY